MGNWPKSRGVESSKITRQRVLGRITKVNIVGVKINVATILACPSSPHTSATVAHPARNERGPAPGAGRAPTTPTQQQEPVRLLQVALLLAEHAVDAPADLPRLPLCLALLSPRLLRTPPPLLLRGGFGPRARQTAAGARREGGRGRAAPHRRPGQGGGRGRDRGRAGPRVLCRRFRGGAGDVLRIPEEQRPQTVAQTHVDAGVRGAGGSGRGPGGGAGGGCTRTRRDAAVRAGGVAGPGRGPRPLTVPEGHFAFSAGCRGWRPPGLEIT